MNTKLKAGNRVRIGPRWRGVITAITDLCIYILFDGMEEHGAVEYFEEDLKIIKRTKS